MTNYRGASGWTATNIYETSLSALEGVIRKIAPTKHVEIPADHSPYVAEHAGEEIDLPDHYGLLHENADACERAAAAVHRAIDAHYLLQVGVRIARFFNMPEAAPSYASAFTESALRALHGEGGFAAGYVWPPPEQFAAELLTGQPFATLFWRPSEGGFASLSMRFWNRSGEHCPPPSSLASEVHRPSADGPAVRRTDAAGTTVLEIYIEHGRRHRDPSEGPAFIQRVEEDGRVRLIHEYSVDGVLHRPPGEGPAVIETDESGRVLLEIYMEHGKRHRDPVAGPALYEIEDIDGEVAPFFEYWQHGVLHRPSADGPAVRKTDMAGCLLLEVYFEHGKRHRNPADGPAFFVRKTDGQEVRLVYQYFSEGALHRDARQGPAGIETDAGGHVLLENYLQHGSCHRDPADGPALIERDPATGAVLREEYHREGLLHRDEHEGPAVACFAPGRCTIDPTHEVYFCSGEPHRLAGPAVLARCPDTGTITEELHHHHGALHREDGPAIVLRHPDGTIYFEAWYRDGQFLEDRGDPSAEHGHDPEAVHPLETAAEAAEPAD